MHVEFSDPSKVSAFRDDKDSFTLVILKPELFEGVESKRKLEKDSCIVPAQFGSNSPGASDLVKQFFGDSFKAFFTGNVILTVIFSTNMQFMWGLINSLQINVLTVLLNLKTPVNSLVVLSTMLQLSNFDVIDMEPLYKKVFRFSETKSFNQIFEEAGY